MLDVGLVPMGNAPIASELCVTWRDMIYTASFLRGKILGCLFYANGAAWS